MKTRKTSSNNRTTYKYTYFVPNESGGYDEKRSRLNQVKMV